MSTIVGVSGTDMRMPDTSIRTLTAHRREILLLMAAGLENGQIGDALCISCDTVKTHVKQILKLLGAQNRTQAVIFALKRGLIGLHEIEIPDGE